MLKYKSDYMFTPTGAVATGAEWLHCLGDIDESLYCEMIELSEEGGTRQYWVPMEEYINS